MLLYLAFFPKLGACRGYSVAVGAGQSDGASEPELGFDFSQSLGRPCDETELTTLGFSWRSGYAAPSPLAFKLLWQSKQLYLALTKLVPSSSSLHHLFAAFHSHRRIGIPPHFIDDDIDTVTKALPLVLIYSYLAQSHISTNLRLRHLSIRQASSKMDMEADTNHPNDQINLGTSVRSPHWTTIEPLPQTRGG